MNLTFRLRAYALVRALSSPRVVATLAVMLVAVSFGHAADTKKKQPSATPKAGQSDVRTSAGSTSADGIQVLLKKPKIAGHLRGGRPVLTSISGEFSGGQLMMEGQLNLASPSGGHFARIHLSDVRLAPVLALLGEPASSAADARISGIVNVRWSGTKLESIRRTVEGKVSLVVADASISSAKVLKQISQVGGIEQLQNLTFTGGSLEALLHDGEVEVISHTLEGPLVSLSSTGKVDLLASTMDLTVKVDVAERLAFSSARFAMAAMLLETRTLKQGGQELRYVRIPEMRLGGSLLSPVVRGVAGTKVAPADDTPAEPAGIETSDQFALN